MLKFAKLTNDTCEALANDNLQTNALEALKTTYKDFAGELTKGVCKTRVEHIAHYLRAEAARRDDFARILESLVLDAFTPNTEETQSAE